MEQGYRPVMNLEQVKIVTKHSADKKTIREHLEITYPSPIGDFVFTGEEFARINNITLIPLNVNNYPLFDVAYKVVDVQGVEGVVLGEQKFPNIDFCDLLA